MEDVKQTKTDRALQVIDYILSLPDGRQMYVELPWEFALRGRDGELLLRPAGARHLEAIRVLATREFASISPAHLITLRQALDFTQEEFGHAVGVDKMTVSRWERGTRNPGAESLRKIKSLREKHAKQGVLLHA